MTPGSKLLFNGDDALLWNVRRRDDMKVTYFGVENAEADYRAVDIQENPGSLRFRAVTAKGDLELELPQEGLHYVIDAMSAVGVGMELDVKPEQICSALASEAEDKGQAVYQTIAEGLNGKIKGKLMDHLGNPYVRRTFELSRAVGNETHHLLGFTRFEETENGILFAEIHPKNRVLPFLMPHFADRFPGENFVIRDRSRNLYGIHQAHREWFLAKIENGPEKSQLKFTEEERRIQELFRYFTQKIMIEERENRNLQRQMLPLRFRPDMTEFAQKIQADNSMMDRGCSDRYVDI
jgi:probable DNA metabolism protein